MGRAGMNVLGLQWTSGARTRNRARPPAVDPPMRAELFSVSQLEQHARALAGWHQVGQARGRDTDRLLSRLSDTTIALAEAYTLVAAAVTRGTRVTPAAEWLLDNYHVIQEQIRTARRHLPRGYNRELPRLVNGPGAGTPRVYELALELISHSHGRVDVASPRAFFAAYQSVQPLRLGELWAIPIMLRLALLENLRRVVANVTAGRRERENAGAWADRLIEVAASKPAKVVLVLAEMVREDPPLTNAFVSELARRLQGQGPALSFPIAWLDQRLAEHGQTVNHVLQLVSQSQAADQVGIGNSLGSLRFLGITDWSEFVEALSAVERSLRAGDPAGAYAEMDFATRDAYRHVVEHVAKHSGLSEDEVAKAALGLARKAGTGRQRHVGYFLVDVGRAALERTVRMRHSPEMTLRAAAGRFRLSLYLGAIFGLTATLTWCFTLAVATRGFSTYAFGLVVALLALVSSHPAVAITNWALTLVVRPRALPRLDFSKGIPAEHQTLVAVPTLLTDAAEIDGLLEALEVRYLGNLDPKLSFALVTDFRDAPEEHLPGDAALLQRARDGIQALNARHTTPARSVPPFYLFHRPRRHNPLQGVWMGWERKRGKLEELNAALRGNASRFDTIEGDLGELRRVKYVIVLDSDTQLPRDSAQVLAGTLSHPLNRPCFDSEVGRVTEGYGILQPRVAITMASARGSRFAQLFAGEPGIDPYTRAVSDVYQDVFDEGSFVGKGIYDVDAFARATAGRLPENRILSHDLLESAYARAGLVSDVQLFEDFPATYAADMSRRFRWMCGDWQIAPWLFGRVPGGDGHRTDNPISWLSQWKILDNLRRSLVPVALLTLILGGWALPEVAPLLTAVVVVAVVVLPGLLAAGADLARRPNELPRDQHAREIARTLLRQLLREAFALAWLPHTAFMGALAIARTAQRQLVTGRRMLEWRTARDAHNSTAQRHLIGAYTTMWAAPLAAAAGAWLVARHPPALALGAPMLVLWALAPALAWWVSRPTAPEPSHLKSDSVAFLRTLARRTWRFFETFVTEVDNYLPPDNFQEDPPQGIAHRTSPTNIGLSLTASLAAYDFGYLTGADVVERVTATLRTMDRMQRFRGHFYNWYDTRSLEPLLPMYVSTVDSGNLSGHLATLAAGLSQLAADPIFRTRSFAGLTDTLDIMAEVAHGAADVAAAVAHVKSELQEPPHTLSGAHDLLTHLTAGSAERLRIAVAHRDTDSSWWAERFETECRRALDDLTRMAPWVRLPPAPDVGELQVGLDELDAGLTLVKAAELKQTLWPAINAALARADADRGFLLDLRDAVVLASERATARLIQLRGLAARATELADLDVEFLYDRSRHLLAIGYNVGDHRLDSSFYDLLASEARLASFVAIAQGKLPQEHWFALGDFSQRRAAGRHCCRGAARCSSTSCRSW